MPRKKRERKMLMPPVIKGMSVFGVRGRKANEVVLLLEEYEAIRLLDYQLMNQEEAARHMEISRPTLTRVYEEARRKVARAFVEGRDILIRGGNFYFESNWFKCNDCKVSFSNYEEPQPACPVCGSADTIFLNDFFKQEE